MISRKLSSIRFKDTLENNYLAWYEKMAEICLIYISCLCSACVATKVRQQVAYTQYWWINIEKLNKNKKTYHSNIENIIHGKERL